MYIKNLNEKQTFLFQQHTHYYKRIQKEHMERHQRKPRPAEYVAAKTNRSVDTDFNIDYANYKLKRQLLVPMPYYYFTS